MEALRALRRHAGLTQAELGLLVGARQSVVAMWETGRRMPRSEKLPVIAQALGCSIDDLFSPPRKSIKEVK